MSNGIGNFSSSMTANQAGAFGTSSSRNAGGALSAASQNEADFHRALESAKDNQPQNALVASNQGYDASQIDTSNLSPGQISLANGEPATLEEFSATAR